MGKGDQSYFAQRAAEETAAADSAACATAARAHRELSLRYALSAILPGAARAGDETRPIGQPKASQRRVAADAARPARKRNRA